MAYLRFALFGFLAASGSYLLLHMGYGALTELDPIGWIQGNWGSTLYFAQCWILLAVLMVLRPNPWVGSLIAVGIWAFEYTVFSAIPLYEVGRYTAVSQWYGLRPLIFQIILIVPAIVYCKLGARFSWRLESFDEVRK